MGESPADIPDWPRPLYEPSPGAAATLLYLVVGTAPQGLNLRRARHHVDRVEENLIVSRHARADDPAWFDAWFSGPPGAEIDDVFGDRAAAVRGAARLSVVRGEFPDPPTLGYLRNAIGVVSAIAEAGAVAVFDAMAFNWWRPEDWLRRFVDASAFRVEEQVSIAVRRAAPEGSMIAPGLWTHTRGMRKFGRPDLQITGLPGAYDVSNPAIRDSGVVLNGVATYLARGATIHDGQSMRLPSVDGTIAFLATPADDPAARRYFGNDVLEIREVDPDTGVATPGIRALLAAMADRRPAGE